MSTWRKLEGWWRRARKYPPGFVILEGSRRALRRLRLGVRGVLAEAGMLGQARPPGGATGPGGSSGSFARALAGRLGLEAPRPGEGWPDSPPFAAEPSSSVLAEAQAIREHCFDLLGSGRSTLGRNIDWAADFKGGCRWPHVHYSRVPIRLGRGCDVKVPWELGRFQHLAPLVKAYALTGERRWAEEIRFQVDDFIQANPPEIGVQWLSAMDVAIRATNWIYALLFLSAGGKLPDDFRDRWLVSLWQHGDFIRRNLSWNRHSRGNHYLSELVGLLHIGLVFSDRDEGRAWAQSAARSIRGEIRHQVREDGVDWESSTNYHRLVTELFAQAATVIERTSVSLGLPEDAEFETVLGRMFECVHAYTRPDGSAPVIGDADDGRLLAFAGYSIDPRAHRRSLEVYPKYLPAGEPAPVFGGPGGLHVLRAARSLVAVRCGPVGMNGRGAHDHADQLSVDVTLDGVVVVADPGCYVYTADLETRDRFRGTAAHSTLMLDGQDQTLFSQLTPFEVDVGATGTLEELRATDRGVLFRGRHDGYRRLRPPVTHRRRVELTDSGGRVEIEDRLDGPAADRELTATFQLDAGCEARVEAPGPAVRIEKDGRAFRWTARDADRLTLTIEDGWVAPRYGVKHAAPRLVLRGPVRVPYRVAFEIELVDV